MLMCVNITKKRKGGMAVTEDTVIARDNGRDNHRHI